MEGGVLAVRCGIRDRSRSILAARLGQERATRLAARLGQTLAAVVIVLSVARLNPWLPMLGVIVLLSADYQARAEAPGRTARLRWVREAMQVRFETLDREDLLADAARKALETGQDDFPVVDGHGTLIGVLRRAAMLEGLAGRGPETSVIELTTRAVPTIATNEPLGAIPARVAASHRMPVLVVEDGRPVGMIPTERLVESLLLDHVHDADSGTDTVGDGLRTP